MAEQFVLQGEIFVVDDDPTARDALSVVFTLAGYHVTAFPDGASFLTAARQRIPTCVLLDINMPGESGIDTLKALDAPAYPAPIFMVSGQQEIATAIEAIKCGAHDYIEKPFDPAAVLKRVRETLAARARRSEERKRVLRPRFPGRDLLTPREAEVLAQIAGGASNKETGRRLGISPRTVEVHRARIMDKLNARNAADLVRIVLSEEAGR